jgi:hypothetical protein
VLSSLFFVLTTFRLFVLISVCQIGSAVL